MREFYPEIEPFHKGRLKVSETHELYFEEVGQKDGQPILFLHGGPGGGISPDHRRYFDPKKYRVILFDQRGCGQSTPFAELEGNTTWDLVKDIEKLREHLKINTWMVFGGSWGSTLSLTYAIQHPQCVEALILRGIFLCRPSEIRWFYQEGASQIFPDYWEEYREFIPPAERDDFVKAYYKRLTSSDEGLRLEAARIWSRWEMATSYLHVSPEAMNTMDDPARALPFARIECHYFINNAFSHRIITSWRISIRSRRFLASSFKGATMWFAPQDLPGICTELGRSRSSSWFPTLDTLHLSPELALH